MYVVCVRIHVMPERVDQFREASIRNARNTRQEPGNLRFDVLQQEQDPHRFTFYEVYRTPEDFAAHQKTAHYLEWRDAVADWMAEPREGIRHRSLFPADEEW